MRGHPPGNLPAHERRTSSQSMQSEMSNQGMPRPGYPPQGRGSGRGFTPQQPPFMGSPGSQYRNMAGGQPPRHMQAPFAQQGAPPGSPFQQGARASPRPMNAQPQMPPMGANQQMPYPGYAHQLHPQHQVIISPLSSLLSSHPRGRST
jgi:translation initiation factor 4G